MGKKVRREPETRGLEPNEELIEVTIRRDDKVIKIGAQLSEGIRNELTSLLRRYANVFAFSMDDLLVLDPEVAEHHLNVDMAVIPVKLRRRYFGAETDQAIEEEVERLLRAEHNEEVQFPEWYPTQLW